MRPWPPRSGSSLLFLPLRCSVVAAPLLLLACGHDWAAYDPRLGAATAGSGGSGSGTGGAAPDGGAGTGAGGAGTGGAGGGAGNAPVTEGLIALYTFEEGAGDTVYDVSDFAPPLDLTIQNPSAVTWAPGKLVVAMPTLITSGAAAAKVIERCKQTNAITLEAWFAPASTDLFGPARIVTNSIDTSQRNFQLGQQYASFYEARIRTTLSVDPNGAPFLESPTDAGHVKLELTHLLVTRDAGGVRRMYVNGVEVAMDMLGGDFSSWDPSYPLLMADELGGGRSWLGEYHRIAIYDRALDAGDVSQNHNAGP
jgi:hypothetical protein